MTALPHVLFAALLAGAAPAVPDPGDPASDAKIAHAALARDLITRARADSDAAMIMVAASVLRTAKIVLVPAEGAPMVIGRARTPTEMAMIGPETLLTEARVLARGDQKILEAIEKQEAAADKGVVPQAIAYTYDLGAGRTLSMPARAEGGRIALVRVRGDGDAALQLAVIDARGRATCVDRPSDAVPVARRDLVCRWTPDRTDTYRIELRNTGRVWSRTILVSN